MIRRLVAMSALVGIAIAGSPARPAQAQAGPLSWNFETGLQGWTVTPPIGGVGWFADGSPGLLMPVPPADEPGVPSAFSPPNSLNYNDGINYDPDPDSAAIDAQGPGNGGNATSPVINLAVAENFGFRCAYDTETQSDEMDLFPQPPAGPGPENVNIFDLRFIEILDNDDNPVFQRQYLADDGENPPSWAPQPPLLTFEECGPRGQWHTHFFTMDPAWGPVNVIFSFQTGAGLGGPGIVAQQANYHTGWFIDDVAVSQQAPGSPSGSGGGGGLRDNANGDKSGNDTFGENWCGAGSARSSFAMFACLVVLAAALMAPLRR